MHNFPRASRLRALELAQQRVERGELADRAAPPEQLARGAHDLARVGEPAEPREHLAAHAQRLGAQAVVAAGERVLRGDHRGDVRVRVIAEPQQARRAPEGDVGEPRRLALAQPLELVEIVGVRGQVAEQPVRLLAPGQRLAPRARDVAVGAAAPSSRSSPSARENATAAAASDAASASRPARSQNAAAPAGSPPRSRCSAIAAGGSSRPAKNRDASSRPTRACPSRRARADSDSYTTSRTSPRVNARAPSASPSGARARKPAAISSSIAASSS